MQFSQIPGLEQIKNQLANTIQMDNMAHAYLFIGPQGNGKLALAIAMAKFLLCSNRSSEDACGQCKHCLQVEKLIHPDLHFAFPTIGSKAVSSEFLVKWREIISENPYLTINQWMEFNQAENKQGNITKDECLDIIKKMNLSSFQSNYKCLVIWLPEYLGKEGNRLLKFIEEPPDNTIIIMVSEEPHKILGTILSRCQTIKIPRFSDNETFEYLKERYNQDEEILRRMSFIANGNLSESNHFFEDEDNPLVVALIDWMRVCFSGEPVRTNAWLDEFAKLGREKQKHFLKYSSYFFSEIYKGLAIGFDHVRLTETDVELSKDFLKLLNESKIEALINIIDDSYVYISRNANAKILFMANNLKIRNILKGKKSDILQHNTTY